MPSARLGWPIPKVDQDPWFDAFVALVQAQDTTAFAAVEDRNAILMGGGLLQFVAGTNTLSWSAAIEINSPNTGYLYSIAAGSLVITDGQSLYVELSRNLTTNATLIAAASTARVPGISMEDYYVVAMRRGSSIYFRNGAIIADGDAPRHAIDQAPSSGGGGGPLSASGEITTPDLAGARFDDYNPTGFDGIASVIVVTNSDANSRITGLKAQTAGRIVLLYAPQSNGDQFTLTNEGGTSLAANRFQFPAVSDWVVGPGSVLGVRYDGGLSRWVPFSYWSERMPSLLLEGLATFQAGIVIIGGGINSSGFDADLVTTGALDSVGILSRGRFLEKSVITPTSITGAQNNYDPVDAGDPTLSIAGARFIRQDLSAAASLTGLAAPNSFNDGQRITIRNINGTFSLTLNHRNGGSSSGNQFDLPSGSNLVIPPFGSADLWHDPISLRWVVV